jgi:hypothetical protein
VAHQRLELVPRLLDRISLGDVPSL